jgi:hypothetical protein
MFEPTSRGAPQKPSNDGMFELEGTPAPQKPSNDGMFNNPRGTKTTLDIMS